MLSIEDVCYFVPETTIDVETNAEMFNISIPQAKVFSRIYGLKKIPVATGLSVTDLITKPIKRLVDDKQINSEQIKVLIHTHTANVITKFGRSVVREVKNDLGLDNALAFGMSLNNCASTLNAIEVASVLLQDYDENAKAIVSVGEMAFTPTVQVIPNVSITADASAAVLINANGCSGSKLLSFEINTVGKYSKGIWLAPEESKDFESSYTSLLSETILRAVEKASIRLDNLTLILPHNVNLISWANVAKRIGFPQEKIYLNNVKKYGHCFGADIFINYADAIADGSLAKGDYFMMATVGLGATFAAAVFKY